MKVRVVEPLRIPWIRQWIRLNPYRFANVWPSRNHILRDFLPIYRHFTGDQFQ